MESSMVLPEEENKRNSNLPIKNCPTAWTVIKETSKVPSQRSLHVSVVMGNSIYIFGGYDGTQRTNDLYRYDLDKSEWFQISPKNSPPSPRDRHAAIVYQNAIYIFGGFDGVNRVNDFYSYELTRNEWIAVPNKGSSLPPSPRHSHAVCVHHNQMYVFSGYDGLYKNDFYKFSFETFEWAMIKDSNPSAENWPKPRYRTTMAVHKERIYMFGGHDGTRQLNDFYFFDTKLEAWEQINLGDLTPSPRDSHVAVTHGDSLYLFGGSTEVTVSTSKNEFYEFSFTESKWHQLSCPNTPSSRFCHVGVVIKKKLYVFGGYDGVNRLNDFYEFSLDNEGSCPESTIISDLAKLVDNTTLCDVKFILEGDKVIHAHKLLLIRVPYFSNMFLGDMKESFEGEIKIPNVSYKTFLGLINYIYTDHADLKDVENIVEMFEVADLYGIERLKSMCEKQIFAMIETYNATAILRSADKRGATKLRDYALNFITKNFDIISKEPSFENLMRTDLDLAIEIIKKRQVQLIDCVQVRSPLIKLLCTKLCVSLVKQRNSNYIYKIKPNYFLYQPVIHSSP